MIGGVNTAISAVYYIRVLKVMVLDKSLDEVEGRAPIPLRVPGLTAAYTGFLAAAVVGLGVAWNFLAAASAEGVRQYTRPAAPEPVVVPRNPVGPGGRPPGPRPGPPPVGRPKAPRPGPPPAARPKAADAKGGPT